MQGSHKTFLGHKTMQVENQNFHIKGPPCALLWLYERTDKYL